MKPLIYLFIFILSLSAYGQSNDDKSAVMTTLEIWDMANNSKDDETLSNLYDATITYYGSKMSKEKCLKDKRRLFKKYPYFSQEISNAEVSEIDTHIYKVSFSKSVITDNRKKAKSYPSYLIIDTEKSKIIMESDTITDKYKQKRAKAKKEVKEETKKEVKEREASKKTSKVSSENIEKNKKEILDNKNVDKKNTRVEKKIKRPLEIPPVEESPKVLPVAKESNIDNTKKIKKESSSRLYSYDKSYTIVGKIQLEHAGDKNEVSTYVLKLNQLIRVVSHDLTSKTTATNEIQLASLERFPQLSEAHESGTEIEIHGKLYAGFSRYHIRDVIMDIKTVKILGRDSNSTE